MSAAADGMLSSGGGEEGEEGSRSVGNVVLRLTNDFYAPPGVDEGTAAVSPCDEASSVATLAASMGADVGSASLWPSPPSESLVAPHMVGSSSWSAVTSFVASTAQLAAEVLLSRFLTALASTRLTDANTRLADAAGAASSVASAMVWRVSTISTAATATEPPATLRTLAPMSFNPIPSTLHAMLTLLQSFVGGAVEAAVPTMAAGGAGAGAGAGAMEEEGAGAAMPWYGGCLAVPSAITSVDGLVQWCRASPGAASCSGIVLGLHTETEVHYVAFRELDSGWCFFDPDGGITLPTEARVLAVPMGVFSAVLQRTAFRFNVQAAATARDAIIQCLAPAELPHVGAGAGAGAGR